MFKELVEVKAVEKQTADEAESHVDGVKMFHKKMSNIKWTWSQEHDHESTDGANNPHWGVRLLAAINPVHL